MAEARRANQKWFGGEIFWCQVSMATWFLCAYLDPLNVFWTVQIYLGNKNVLKLWKGGALDFASKHIPEYSWCSTLLWTLFMYHESNIFQSQVIKVHVIWFQYLCRKKHITNWVFQRDGPRQVWWETSNPFLLEFVVVPDGNRLRLNIVMVNFHGIRETSFRDQMESPKQLYKRGWSFEQTPHLWRHIISCLGAPPHGAPRPLPSHICMEFINLIFSPTWMYISWMYSSRHWKQVITSRLIAEEAFPTLTVRLCLDHAARIHGERKKRRKGDKFMKCKS